MPDKKHYFLVVLSFFFGVMGVFAFAPFHLYPIILISLAGFLWIVLRSSPQQAFRRGFSYGLGFFGAGVYWVYISLHLFGGASMLICLLLTALFIAILSLFPACTAGILNKYFPQNTSVKMWLIFPAIWTLTEWVRTWIFTGFPWLLVGYTQTVWPLSNLAPIGGVYFISFVLAHIAGGLVYFIYAPNFRRRNTLTYIACLLIGCGIVSCQQWTHPSGLPIPVTLVQGNVTPSLKWVPNRANSIVQHYLGLSAGHWDNRLVIWPEAALPVSPFQNSAIFGQLDSIAREHNAGLILGVPYPSPDLERSDYNASIALGEASGLYLKRHLVPFGEYFPVENMSRFFLDWLNIPMSQFKAGQLHQMPMSYGDVSIATFICYEIIFPEEVRQRLKNAGFILMMSDDAWFGHSLAQAQHLQIAQMRAIETGRYVASVTNNGQTAIINQKGKVIASLSPYQTGVLESQVRIYSGQTAWTRFGSNLYLSLCILLIFIGRMTAKRFPILV
ncbi:MAG: apolipoprotein N-acyltransferase [Gammaproteobacteria bacterium]|nr:apolipoprotein N-acyltransferase [Gammaproteobacteria bacterium]